MAGSCKVLKYKNKKKNINPIIKGNKKMTTKNTGIDSEEKKKLQVGRNDERQA